MKKEPVRPIDANALLRVLVENGWLTMNSLKDGARMIAVQSAIDNAPTLNPPPFGKPACYIAEKDNPYPLCVGRGVDACKCCCLWVNLEPEEVGGERLTMCRQELREIVDQLSWCGYECEGGPLEMNVKFMRLKELAYPETTGR